MGLDMFFQELKENLPDKAIDISESLELDLCQYRRH